jgi:tetratricopeptide (TPR) repeat protein
LAIAQDAFYILKELPSTSTKSKCDKIEVTKIVVDSFTLEDNMESAKCFAEEFCQHFQACEDRRGEGYALLSLSKVMLKLDSEDAAMSHVQRAQVLFSEQGDAKGEADTLKMLGDLSWKKSDFKAAIRYAERSRALYREAENLDGEVACMHMISENSIRLSVKEGARIYSDSPIPRQARDALDKGIKMAEAGIKIASSGILTTPELLGSLLCARAQGLTLKAEFQESLNCADEAISGFREMGAYQMEANALMIACDNLRAMQQIKEASEAADEALALYKHVEDTVGEQMAQEVLDVFKQQLKPAQPQYVPPPPVAGQAPQGPSVFEQAAAQAAADAGKASAPGTVAISRGPSGPALDVSAGLTVDVVKSKVLEIAMRITGAEDDEIQADTPLMEAGLTSNSAILMRDELGAALPGVSLPVTLVFDYPSISAMAELVVETAGGKAIRN